MAGHGPVLNTKKVICARTLPGEVDRGVMSALSKLLSDKDRNQIRGG